jgi:hypothetical protein
VGGNEVGGCALEDDPAAVVAGAGAEVDDPVGVRHDRLVVLDDDDRLLVTSAVYHVALEFTTASCACTVVQQRPGTGYAAP